MTPEEKAIWKMMASIGSAVYTTDENIYIALSEGLITMPHPKSSIQWGYTDDGEVTGVYTFKPVKS